MKLEPIVTGLTFPEAPRWHDGRLWFSDFYSHAVYATDLTGSCETIVEVPGQPSGIGWLPDGDLLVVSMLDQAVLRLRDGVLSAHAKLAPLVRDKCNDMIVLPDGSAFVGNFGFDPYGEEPRPTTLVRLGPDGTPSIAAHDLQFPNGMALIDGGRVLVVAESVAQGLTAFDIAADGSLSNRRVFAQTPGCQPDGICVDVDGSVLVTTMTCNQLVRFTADGRHMATYDLGVAVWACAVSGAGDILVCTSPVAGKADCQRERGGAVQRLVLD
ncbi:SMP-30/gluconolactonase/LRE family protein [Novosphingobium lentum]|uniref:SMP-30/gluconolactonase/LRE family protein n=1 Tax=Novosphingobium lentum TaxID=145287 RepID=UPI000B0C39C2|nr:SMP-30/gluconolactonase/LRE family protein [Novosphingobium lentum]